MSKKNTQTQSPKQIENSVFSNKRKPIVPVYSGLKEARNYLGKSIFSRTTDVKDLSTFYNSSQLDYYFKNPGSKIKECISLSSTLYATNRIYQNLIDYLCGMFFWRTVTTPRLVKKEKAKKEEYMKIYNKMVDIVEGFHVEVTYPEILLEIFKKGQVFLCAYGDKASKTMSTILLPNEYCTSSIKTQYGTNQIIFDFKFFETLANNEEERRMLFDMFPPFFEELYGIARQNNSYKLPLDPKCSTSISMNNLGFPTFLSVFYDLIDYKTYKINELDRSTNALERIVTQEIDLESSGIELPEVEALHDSLAEAINGNGTTVITSIGKVDVHQLQEELSQENKSLSTSFKGIFDNAGFNNELFSGDSSEGLDASLRRDMSIVWRYVEEIVNFYNVAVNNIFSFGAYQLSFRVLPISIYNEHEKLELYRQNATFGVGVIDLIVATGLKQIDIEATIELEENLDLVGRLKPLQSSHVQSGNQSSSTVDDQEEDKKVEDESEKDSEVENKDNEDKLPIKE